MENQNEPQSPPAPKTKFCKFCAAQIPEDAVICTACGRQVEEIKHTDSAQPTIVINNENNNTNTNLNGVYPGTPKNKWVAVALCFFLGIFGAHKFYEGKIGMGFLYLITGGLCGIGALIDFISLLTKPNPYYVR